MDQEQFVKLVLFMKDETDIWTVNNDILIRVPISKLDRLTEILGQDYFETLLDCKLGYDYIVITMNDVLEDEDLRIIANTLL